MIGVPGTITAVRRIGRISAVLGIESMGFICLLVFHDRSARGV